MESIRKHKWTVLGIVAYALFMDYFIYGLVVPLSPYSPAKITSESQMGMLYAAYALGVLLATPVFGHLGDKLGCRRPMIIGVVLSGIATLLFCFANSFFLALAARLSQGAAAAATWTAGLALVAGNYSDKRVQMMGLVLVGSTAGSVLGPVAGGWLYEQGGYQFPFLITAAMVLLDALMRTCFLSADSKPAESAHTENNFLIPLLTDKSVLVAGLAVALAAAGFGIVEPILPNHLRQAGIAPAQVGVLFTSSTIVYGLSAPLVEWVSEKFSIKNTIVFGIVAMAAVLPLLALSSDYVLTALCLAAVNVSYAFMLNPSSAELGNAVDRRGLNCYAAVYAIYNITYSLGMIGVDAFASAASEKFSLLQIFGSMSLVLLFSIPFVLKALGSGSQVITKSTIGDSGVQGESPSG